MNYVCSICGKEHVKLWRPYMGSEPLICATCAEKRQSPREYHECTWKKSYAGYVGTPTGRKLLLPKWEVNAEGKIPASYGIRHDGKPLGMTDQLRVNLADISDSYTSGITSMVPAIPDENGNWVAYSSVPEGSCRWWKELPTR